MSVLCLKCNLCCNGSLFARVPVTEEEGERLPDDLEFFYRDGKLRMRLPCTRLGEDGGCTVYKDRPTVCRTYHCKLSKRVEAGEISQDAALAIVSEIKAVQKAAVDLAIKAMGEGAEDIASSHIGRVFRRLKKARKEGLRPNKGFVASRALMQSDRYHRLLRKHLQLNYRGGA